MQGGPDLERLLDAVLLVAGDLDLETVLRRVVEAACILVDARYGALGVIDEEGQGLSAFVHHGIDEDVAERIGELPAGHGILGLLIDEPRPLRLDDIAEHTASYGFPEHHPPMRSFLGTPVRVGEQVFGNLYLTEKRTRGGFTSEDEEMIVALAAVAGSAIYNARLYDDLQRRETWRGAVLELAGMVLAGATTTQVRQRIAHLASELVGGRGACVVVRADSALEVVASAGTAPQPGVLDVVNTGAWAVLETGRPRRAEHGEIFGKPSLWIPIRDGASIAAALGVGREQPFTDREEQLLVGFGEQVSVTWTYERAQRELRRLSLVEERERIGRDLHDTVIQRLFATGLSLQAVIRQLDDTPDIAERIVRAVDDVDMTVKEIRSTIFALQAPEPQLGAGLRTRLLEVVDEVATLMPATPRVRFDGPLDTVVGRDVVHHLVPALREALTNVAKHAAAGDVEVDVRAADGMVRLSVTDDGGGIDPDAPAGFGLANLRERAEALGGSFDAASGPAGRGTRVTWQVPVG